MLTSTTQARAGAVVMRMTGVLSARTYRQVRDSVIEVAVDAAAPVIVDVDALQVRESHAWTVFTSARWHVKQWPEVPIALVSSNPAVHKRLNDLSVTRYVPIYFDVTAASAAIGAGTCRYRHRAREHFSPRPASVNSALHFVNEHLLAWGLRDRIPVASTVVTVFAENALSHSAGGLDVRLECGTDEVIVAVSDTSTALAVRRERPPGSSQAGLDIVSALCCRWGNTPLSTGKTVWARIGPGDPVAGTTGL